MQNKKLIFSEPFAKNHWLKIQVENRRFENVIFKNGWMPLTQVKNSYPFFIDKHFQIKPDLSKRILPYLDYIELNQSYDDSKLTQLQSIKKSLIEHHLMKPFDASIYKVVQLDGSYVPSYISTDENIDLIEPKAETIDVYKAINQEEQVYAVFERIVAMLESGIDIETIKVINASEDDCFKLKRLCEDANIPIWFHQKKSIRLYPIYQTIKSSLLTEGIEETKALILTLKNKQPRVMNALIHLFNRYSNALIQDQMKLFLSELESVQIPAQRMKNAIEVLQVNQISDMNHHYLMMNFIDELFPPKSIDNDYLTNHQRRVIGYPTTDDINQYRLKIYGHMLDGMSHLTIFYPAKMIEETRLSQTQVSRKMNITPYRYLVKEKSYLKGDDRLRYAMHRYLYEQFQMTHKDDGLLNQTFKDTQIYSPQFKGIYSEDLNRLLNHKFTLTGTKIEILNLCPFQYLLTYLLELNDVEPNHYIYFGNQIHHALEQLVKNKNFDYRSMVLDSEDFPKDLHFKKTLFQKMLIDNIEKIYDIVSDFHQHALYQDVMTEKYIERQIHPQDRYIIKGFIDKVMIDEENGYYAIVDYKYSSKSFNMSSFERGLRLQLPFYLYLFDEETNLKPSGVFFRQTGMNREKSQETMNLKMNGVFLNDEKQMKRLDPQANHISGLGYKKDGTLRKNANQLSENEFNDMHHKMEEMIVEAAEKIEKGQFEINPILNIEENHQSISCQYCPFGAICYSKNKRLKEDSREIHNITK